MAKISVLGAGSWGTALALLLYNNGHDVILWSALGEEIDTLREKRENVSKLPGVKIPEPIDITVDLERSLKNADVAVLAVPSSLYQKHLQTNGSVSQGWTDHCECGKRRGRKDTAESEPDHRAGTSKSRCLRAFRLPAMQKKLEKVFRLPAWSVPINVRQQNIFREFL